MEPGPSRREPSGPAVAGATVLSRPIAAEPSAIPLRPAARDVAVKVGHADTLSYFRQTRPIVNRSVEGAHRAPNESAHRAVREVTTVGRIGARLPIGRLPERADGASATGG